MSREYVLHRVRMALGRSVEQPPAPVPPPRIAIPEMDAESRISLFCRSLQGLAAQVHCAGSPAEAGRVVASLIQGETAVASNASFLRECGIPEIAGVSCGFADRDALRQACAAARFGITGAEYALAETGSLVMLASPEQARTISLVPPVHVAVVRRECVLSGLDELLTRVPRPADLASSMVLITGPSRTADIEMILVRGVHGPGELHVVIV